MKKTFLWAFLLMLFLPVVAMAADYQIGEGDTLQIAVWGVKELNFPVKVRPDGKITIPGLGEVTASGKSPSQLQGLLTERLKSLVKSPIVTVTVMEITNSKVYVFGSGIKSSVYDLSRRTTLLQLLCSLPEVKMVDLQNAYLLRGSNRVGADLYKLFVEGDITQDVVLQPGDSLFMPLLSERSVYVVGAVNTPKTLEYREGMKVMEAILESGGFNKFADQNDVVVRRKGAEIAVKAKKIFNDGDLGQNVELKAGDYVIVKETFF